MERGGGRDGGGGRVRCGRQGGGNSPNTTMHNFTFCSLSSSMFRSTTVGSLHGFITCPLVSDGGREREMWVEERQGELGRGREQQRRKEGRKRQEGRELVHSLVCGTAFPWQLGSMAPSAIAL